MRSLLISTICGLILAMGISSATFAASATRGKVIARRNCETCHLNSSTLPSFPDIARRKTNAQLAQYLGGWHPKMPDFDLSNDDIADLIDYIRSLAR